MQENKEKRTRNRRVKREVWVIVYLVLCVLLLIFIFGNSMKSQETSSDESTFVARIIKRIIDPNDKIAMVTFHAFIRKVAHFVEYAALGFLLFGFFRLIKINNKIRFVLSAGICLAVGACDEIIQIFSHRGPGVKDVILDFCGALFGIAVMMLVAHLIKNHRQKHTK